MKMYKVPKQGFYNDASWNRVIIHIQTSNIEMVRLYFSHLPVEMRNEELLHEAIIRGTPDIVEFLLLQGITAKDEDIETCAIYACAMYGCDLSMIEYLITKGYTFNSIGAMALANDYHDNFYHYYEEDTCLESIQVYEFISKRYIIRELYESNEGYLSWLSHDLYDLL